MVGQGTARFNAYYLKRCIFFCERIPIKNEDGRKWVGERRKTTSITFMTHSKVEVQDGKTLLTDTGRRRRKAHEVPVERPQTLCVC
jgi:hypothetical protein